MHVNLRESTSHVADMQTECHPDPGSQALDDPQLESEVDSTVPLCETEVPGLEIDIALEELSELAKLVDIKISMEFIQALKTASLDDDMGLDPETIKHLRDAPQQPINIVDSDLCLLLNLFLSVSNSSQETYTSARKAILCHHTEDEILTYDSYVLGHW
jgi:hypothetical protein